MYEPKIVTKDMFQVAGISAKCIDSDNSQIDIYITEGITYG
ncbi:hypothetical protein ACFOU2_17160 [Bacillus songklensis]|uniref:Uncharacterized protein n=1 Tax=Bacillus songklensis TaxID=1069116 RepID=A0ABV8B7E2_9BACI